MLMTLSEIIKALKKQSLASLTIKRGLVLELITILSLGLISLWLSFGGLLPVVPWLAVWITLLTTWFLPGFLLWRIFGGHLSRTRFSWLTFSFGLGLFWLMLGAIAGRIFELKLDTFVGVIAILNSLLLCIYLVLRFVSDDTSAASPPGGHPLKTFFTNSTDNFNIWPLSGGALLVVVALLAVFFNTAGFRAGSDEWSLMATIRSYLDGSTIVRKNVSFDFWNFILAYIVYLSDIDLLDTYRFYLPPIFIMMAILAHMLLADTLFHKRSLVYFAVIVQGLYFLSDIRIDSNGLGTGFLARIQEDKFAAWLLVLPIAQTFFIKFLESGRYRHLLWFGLMASVAVAVHPVAITWLLLSAGAVGLFLPFSRDQIWNDPQHKRSVLIFYVCFYLLVAGGIFLNLNVEKFDGLSRFQRSAYHTSIEAAIEYSSPLGFALNSRRLWVIDPEQNRYMLHPFLISHPLVILSLFLSLWLIPKLRHSLTAQFLFSNMAIVCLLFFNPITAPLIGRLTSLWLLNRIIWVLPISLTITYALYYIGQNLSKRLTFVRKDRWLYQLGPSITGLVLVILLWNPILSSWRSLHAWNNLVIPITEKNLMSEMRQVIEPDSVVFAPHFLNIRLPASISRIYLVTQRLTGTSYSIEPLLAVNRFYETEWLDQAALDTLIGYKADYVVSDRTSVVDSQFKLYPRSFSLLYENSDYALYAFHPEQTPAREARLIEGNTHLRQGKWDAAEADYENVLQQQADQLPALLGLGVVYEAKLDFEKAIAIYQRAGQVAPQNPWPLFKLANTHILHSTSKNERKIEDPWTLYNQAIELAPDNVLLHDQILAAYGQLSPNLEELPLIQDLLESLLNFYQRRAKNLPDQYETQQQLASAYEQVGEIDQALAQYSRMTQIFPGNIQPFMHQARIFSDQGEVERAVDMYHKAIEHQPQPASGTPYLGLARLYRQQQDLAQALLYAQRAVSIEWHNPSALAYAYFEQGLIYQHQQQFSRAEESFLMALENAPDDAYVHAIIGDFYKQKNDLDQALFYHRRATEIHPQAWSYLSLGEILFTKGQFEEGRQELEKARIAAPDANTIHRIGNLLWQYQSSEQAQPYLEQAIALAPNNPHIHLTLARFYRQQGDYQRAQSHVQQSLTLFKDDYNLLSAHIEQANIYQSQGKVEEGLAWLLKSTETITNDSRLYVAIGHLYKQEGDLQQALFYYRQGTDRVPSIAQHYLYLGETLLEIGHIDEGIETLDFSTSLAPESSPLYQKIGSILTDHQKLELAVPYLQKAIELDSNNIEARLHLETALTTLGRPLDAASVFLDTGYGQLYANWQLSRYYASDASKAFQYRSRVRHFSLENILLPNNKSFINRQALAFLGAVADGLWSREKLNTILAYYIWQSQAADESVETLLKAMTQFHSDEPALYFYLGEFYRQQGDIKQAEVAYRMAVEIEPTYAEAYLSLGLLNELSSEPNYAEAVSWYKQYNKLDSNEPLGLKKLADVYQNIDKTKATDWHKAWLNQVDKQGPAVLINQVLENGWTFVGYRHDEKRLIRGEPSPLWLYWQGPMDSTPGDATEGWYQLEDGRWLQLLETANNLVINGNFELGSMAGESPAHFPEDIYNAPPVNHKLVIETRNGEATMMALLENSEVYSRTSYVSEPIPVEEENLYLQSGWLFSPTGNAFLGRAWDGDFSGDVTQRYSYVASNVQATDWQHYVRVAEPLPGSDRVRVWLLNYQSTGRAYFDDVIFVKIGRPKNVETNTVNVEVDEN